MKILSEFFYSVYSVYYLILHVNMQKLQEYNFARQYPIRKLADYLNMY